jgi:hypothetical protein
MYVNVVSIEHHPIGDISSADNLTRCECDMKLNHQKHVFCFKHLPLG